jgi:hypothetical protein
VGNSDNIGGCRRLGSVVGGGTASAVGEAGKGGLPTKDEGGTRATSSQEDEDGVRLEG